MNLDQLRAALASAKRSYAEAMDNYGRELAMRNVRFWEEKIRNTGPIGPKEGVTA